MSAERRASLIWRMIEKLSKNEPLECTEDELKTFVTDELELQIEQLNSLVQKNLCVVLVAYVNAWPGWEIFKGRAVLENYCSQLKTYLRYKFAKPRAGAFYSALEELVNKPVDNENSSTAAAAGDFSSFNIQIGCPPSIMNSLVFTTMDGKFVYG